MKLSVLAVVGVMAVSQAAFAAQMPSEINITYVKSPFNLQNFVMKDQKMLEKAFEKDGVKINWRVINSGAVQAQAMAAGSLDVSAVMNTPSLLLAASAGNPIKIATGVAHPGDVYALVAAEGIGSVKELKGKTVAGPKGTVLHQMLIAALKKEGMTINDVKFVNMDPAQAMNAVVAKKVDAGLLAANLIIKANEAGAKTIATGEGLIVPNLVMTVRQGFVDDYPEAFERVVAVNRAALKWIKENEEAALAIGAKEQDISIEDARTLYSWSNFYDVLGEQDVKGLEADQEFLIENGLMKTRVDVRSLILPSALK